VSKTVHAITVSILDRDYRVSCGPGEKAVLLESADLLNSKMGEIRDTGRVVGVDRIAVMAALNLAREVLELSSERAVVDSAFGERIGRIESLLEESPE